MAGKAVLALALCILAVKAADDKSVTLATAEAPKVILVTHASHDDKPFVYSTGKPAPTNYQGYLVDLSEEVIKRLDPQAVVQHTFEDEKLNFILMQTAKVAFMTKVKRSQETQFTLSRPYLEYNTTAIVLRNSSLNSFEDLNKTKDATFTFAYLKGDDTRDRVVEGGKDTAQLNGRMKKEGEMHNVSEALEAVRTGNAALFIAEPYAMQIVSNNCDLKMVKAFPPAVSYSFGFSLDTPPGFSAENINVTTVNAMLDALQKDGTLGKLRTKWLDSVPCAASVAVSSVFTFILVSVFASSFAL